MARILTAVAPDAEERVRRILTGHELLFVNDLGAAKRTVEHRDTLSARRVYRMYGPTPEARN